MSTWLPVLPINYEPPFMGYFNLLSPRAFLVGKTIVGMRMDDTIQAVDWLCARPDVDRPAITAYGNGPLGMVVLLHAAALDTPPRGWWWRTLSPPTGRLSISRSTAMCPRWSFPASCANTMPGTCCWPCIHGP